MPATLDLATELEALLKRAKPQASGKARVAAPTAPAGDFNPEAEADDDTPQQIWVSGSDGQRVPADYHPKTKRIRVRYEDYAEQVRKAYNPDEARDAHGRWSKLKGKYSAGYIVGQDEHGRDLFVAKHKVPPNHWVWSVRRASWDEAGHQLSDHYLDTHPTEKAAVNAAKELCSKLQPVQKSLSGVPIGDFAAQLLTATQAFWMPLCKGGVDTTGTIPAGVTLSAEEMKAMKLTWITAHPNGKEHDGVPLIVHDNGDHYVVVGGAGGKLNQMLLPKGEGGKKDPALAAAAKEKQQAQQEAFQREDPEAFGKLQASAKVYKDAAQEALSAHVATALEHLGTSLPAIKAEARKAAEAKAKEDPDATPEEVEKFALAAEKAAETQATKQVQGAMQTALDAVAKAEINQEAITSQDLEVTVGGKKLVKELSPEALKELITQAATLDHLKVAEKAVQKALKTGKTDMLPGLQALLEETAPSAEDVSKWLQTGYLQRQSIKSHVQIVQESQRASKSSQLQAQALGAADALNGYAAMATGSAILDPATVQYLGPEASARVLAAHLTSAGFDTGNLADKLGAKIADKGDLQVAAALRVGGEIDGLIQGAIKAAEAGDGTVTWSQALILQENQLARKHELLNITRGQLQAASSLYQHLSKPSTKPLILKGGETAIATRARAKGLGLETGDYDVQEAKGGFQLAVKPEAIAKLAHPTKPALAERTARMTEIKKEAELGGAGSWKPSGGWQDGTGEPEDGKTYRIDLAPHQIAAARAIVEMDKLAGNLSAGSGKTYTMYAAMSELLHTGKRQRGIITMPSKPRAQQEDYTETAADGTKSKKDGELKRSLTPEMRARFKVVKSGAHLEKLLAANPNQVLVMSPELMRDKADVLKAAGYHGDSTAFMGDEAHELSIGTQDREGSGKAQAARELARSCGTCFLGSGTLIESNGSELHSLLSFLDPKAFPDSERAAFADKWERVAQSGKEGPLGAEMRGAIGAEVGGYMTHYHQDPTTPDGKPVKMEHKKEVVPLDDSQKAAIVAANEQRSKDETDPDENVRAASALRWNGAVQRATIGAPMYEHITDYVGERRKKDPTYKAVLWSQELLPIHGEMEADGKTPKQGGEPGIVSRLTKHGKVVTVTGANSDMDTKKTIEAFQKDPDVVAIVVSNAGNFGLNLQAAHSVIKMGIPPMPSKDQQLDARAMRRGQDKDIETVTYHADHPLLHAAYNKLHQQRAKSLGLLKDLSDDSLLGSLLAEYGPAGDKTQVAKGLARCLELELALCRI